MRRPRDISLTIALCLSLTAHAWIVYTVAERYMAQFGVLRLPALAIPEQFAAVAPEPQPPPPPRVVERMSQLGYSEGIGDALASSAGETPQTAELAEQVQAALSRDPEGAGGKAEPAPPIPPAPLPAPPAFAAAPSSESSRAFSVPGSTNEPATMERADRTKMPISSPAVDRPAPQPTQAAQSNAPGDPAPQAESESDAFATTPSAKFTRGMTTARLGRKHKLVRPRLEMAGQADLMQLRPPVTIVLRLSLNAEGNVEKVDIVKSSGSINVDQPTRQAAYRWWFEPAKDSAGRPKADVFEFICRFT